MYQDTLSASEVIADMAAAWRNVRRLAGDAALLLAAGGWPSAASMAILSIEESGKIGIRRLLSSISDPAALKAGWKACYRSHPKKLSVPIGINPDGTSMASAEVVTAAQTARDKLVAHVDHVKQYGFCTD